MQCTIVPMVYLLRDRHVAELIEVKVASFFDIVYAVLEGERAVQHETENLQRIGHDNATAGNYYECWQ